MNLRNIRNMKTHFFSLTLTDFNQTLIFYQKDITQKFLHFYNTNDLLKKKIFKNIYLELLQEKRYFLNSYEVILDIVMALYCLGPG